MAKDTYRVMITSLYGGGPKDSVDYYNYKEDEKYIYCDAILSAEASSKYILAKYDVDEIVTLGSKSSFDPGDELVPMILREGSSFYASDINKLSSYSLLRYRLAQFLDEIRIEEQDVRDLLSEEEQQKTIEAVKNSFKKLTQDHEFVKFNRFFDMLDMDDKLKNDFTEDVINQLDPDHNKLAELRKWILNYLYSELRSTLKMEPLSSNIDVKVRFIPTDGHNMSFANVFIDSLLEAAAANNATNIELFICIQSEDADDTYTLMNLMDIIKSMPGEHVRITKVVTSTLEPGELASEIKDSTELYGVGELLSGMRSFLISGKTDILINYWNAHRTNNEYIDRLLMAMRNIDIGISLCDVSDIERGIMSLKRLFKEEPFKAGDSLVEHYFSFIIFAIKEDYGKLLEDDADMIDLVKWAYRKGFWQQTLTLVESKTPEDFVSKGIYYYCGDKQSKENATRKLAEIFNDLKPFEKYKLDDISHYFVKFYGRGRVKHGSNLDDSNQKYVKFRINDLHPENNKTIQAFSGCSDEEALGNLLYAYYNIGTIRNETNHASNDSGQYGIPKRDEDVSERLNSIKRAIEGFIEEYEHVMEIMGDNRPDVWRISNDEIRAVARTMKFDRDDDHRDGGQHHDGQGNGGQHHQGGGYRKYNGPRHDGPNNNDQQ